MTDANETLGKRVREAEMQKIPYVLVVGEKEEKNGTVSVRRRGSASASPSHKATGEHGKSTADKQDGEISMENLFEKIKNEIAKKTI
jgi:threonyl-tRNA synthetase